MIDMTNFFIELIENFLGRKISSLNFERSFISLRNKVLDAGMSYEDDVLEELFFDIDAFCSDPELVEEGDLTEEELRESCRRTLKELKEKGYQF